MQIIDFVVCDDIRFEIDGKRSFIGVVEDTFPILSQNKNSKLPIFITFSIAIRAILSPKEVENDPATLEVVLNINSKKKSLGKGPLPPSPLTKNKPRKISAAMVFKNFPIDSVGKLTAILIVMDKEGKIIAEKETDSSVMMEIKGAKEYIERGSGHTNPDK